MLKYFKNHFFRMTFLIYFLLIEILILVFFTVFLYQQQNVQAERIQSESLAEAEKMVRIVDEKFNMMDQIAAQVSSSRWQTYVAAKSDILYSNVDYFDKKEICQQLETMQVLLSVAQSTAIIFPQKDLAVDGKSFWETERYFKSIKLSEDWVNQLEEILEGETKAIKLFAGKEDNDTNAGFIVLKQLSPDSASRGILFVLVEGKYFQKFVKTNLPNAVHFSIRQDGVLIYDMPQSDPEEETMQVCLPSNIYQWEYCFSVRVSASESNFWNLYYSVGIGFGLSLAAVLSYLLARLTNRPIAQILKKFDWAKGAEYHGLERVEQVYRELETEKEHLEELGVQYYQIGKTSLLRSLLLGTYEEEHISDHVRRFHVEINRNMAYLVMTFQLLDTEMQDSFMDTLLKFQIECFHNKITAIMCSIEEEQVLLLGTEEGKDALVNQSEKLNLFMDEYLPEVDLEIYAGDAHMGFKGISISYQEVQDKLMRSKNPDEQLIYYYPFDEEIRMINQMRNGNFIEVQNILLGLEKENAGRKVLPEIEKKMIDMIAENLMRFVRDMDLGINIKSNRYMELNESGDMNGMWEFLRKQVSQIEEAYQESRQLYTLGISLVKYVDENYTNSGLSQQDIADRFGVSRPTVSKTFKETVNMNFVDYLQIKRVEYAKELIAQGNYDVLEVAKKIGYENEVTFKRAFVKNEGITPREYVKRKRLHV